MFYSEAMACCSPWLINLSLQPNACSNEYKTSSVNFCPFRLLITCAVPEKPDDATPAGKYKLISVILPLSIVSVAVKYSPVCADDE